MGEPFAGDWYSPACTEGAVSNLQARGGLLSLEFGTGDEPDDFVHSNRIIACSDDRVGRFVLLDVAFENIVEDFVGGAESPDRLGLV